MKIQENVTVYKCEFCSKKLFRKGAMTRHEEFCTHKPENIPACSGCQHIERVDIEYESLYSNDYGEAVMTKVQGFKCAKLDKLLYPKKAEKKGLIEKYPETFEGQAPMPIKCSSFSLDYRL